MKVVAALFCAALLSVAAHADTVYTISGTMADGGTISGTITFASIGVVDGSNFTVDGIAFTGSPSSSYGPGTFASNNFYAQIFSGPVGDNFALSYLASFEVCTLSSGIDCNALSGGVPVGYGSDLQVGQDFIFVTSATLTPYVAPSGTPEPSSLMLLGTGVVGIVGALRRRVIQR